MPHESVKKSLKNGGGIYWFNDELELSGYYGYDEQWIRIKGNSNIESNYSILIICPHHA